MTPNLIRLGITLIGAACGIVSAFVLLDMPENNSIPDKAEVVLINLRRSEFELLIGNFEKVLLIYLIIYSLQFNPILLLRKGIGEGGLIMHWLRHHLRNARSLDPNKFYVLVSLQYDVINK